MNDFAISMNNYVYTILYIVIVVDVVARRPAIQAKQIVSLYW